MVVGHELICIQCRLKTFQVALMPCQRFVTCQNGRIVLECAAFLPDCPFVVRDGVFPRRC